MLMGGTLNLHGSEKSTWTKLAKTAEAGSTSIEVLSAADWKAGEEIVLASTDFDPRQAERRTIAAIHANTNGGNTITLDKKLDYMRTSARSPSTWMNAAKSVCYDAQHQTSRHRPTPEQSFYGGHVMAMVGSKDVCRGRRIQSNGSRT